MPLSPALTLAGQSPGALALLVLAGAAASALNAFAGGGTLISFPTMVALGVPQLAANATNSVALWPGGLSSAIGYLPRMKGARRPLLVLLGPTLAGALGGAWLLVHTSERTFAIVVPLLLALATALLLVRTRLQRWALGGRVHLPIAAGALLQVAVAAYGGYFGAGMGIIMLAVFGLFVEGDLHRLNAIKNWLGLVINLVASLFFFGKGLVWLVPGGALMLGAIVGGYVSARVAQRVDAEKLRIAVVVLGVAMTLWFGWKALGR